MSAIPLTTPVQLRPSELDRIARFGDLVMLLTLVASAAASVAIGRDYGDLGLALAADALIVAIGAVAYAAWRGTLASQMLLVTCNVALVALHIQLGRGTTEFHFGVFVLLGLTLVYRDFRPIVLTAALFAVHHVTFDRLQAAGAGLYCTPSADFFKTAMHAVYVVVQTAIEIFLAVRMHKAAVESAELNALVERINRSDRICLDVADVETTSAVAGLLKDTLVTMGAAIADVGRAAASIEVTTTEIANGTVNLGERTEEQATGVQQTSASIDQLATTFQTTAESSGRASQLAGLASSAASDGGALMSRVVTTMNGISQRSRTIVDIVGVIEGISFQTNILALNAAVEASRAGEHGRGFAVVAAEVRALAKRSAESAKEIKQLIGGSTEEIKVGSELVDQAGSSILEIVAKVQRVGAIIQEITSLTTAQSGGIGEVNQALKQLDDATQQNSALVEQSTAATLSLQQQAQQLNRVVNRFSTRSA